MNANKMDMEGRRGANTKRRQWSKRRGKKRNGKRTEEEENEKRTGQFGEPVATPPTTTIPLMRYTELRVNVREMSR